MADTDQAETPKKGIEETPRLVRSEKYVSLYTNQVELGFSAWDIQFSLMQIHGRISDVIGEEIATITMSPQHAKAMVIPLMNTIIQYEGQHGVVKIPGQKEPVSLSDMIKGAVEKKLKEKAGGSGEESQPAGEPAIDATEKPPAG